MSAAFCCNSGNFYAVRYYKYTGLLHLAGKCVTIYKYERLGKKQEVLKRG